MRMFFCNYGYSQYLKKIKAINKAEIKIFNRSLEIAELKKEDMPMDLGIAAIREANTLCNTQNPHNPFRRSM